MNSWYLNCPVKKGYFLKYNFKMNSFIGPADILYHTHSSIRNCTAKYKT